MRVLLPLPATDFDVTEVAVTWRTLTGAGHEVVFAGERADAALAADPLLLTGVVFGQLGAATEAKRFYEDMLGSASFRSPIAWADIEPEAYHGLVLAGGHAQ